MLRESRENLRREGADLMRVRDDLAVVYDRQLSLARRAARSGLPGSAKLLEQFEAIEQDMKLAGAYALWREEFTSASGPEQRQQLETYTNFLEQLNAVLKASVGHMGRTRGGPEEQRRREPGATGDARLRSA